MTTTTEPRIWLDRSPETVVIVCTCGWRTITTTRAGAHRIAAAHERRAHPGRRQARKRAWEHYSR